MSMDCVSAIKQLNGGYRGFWTRSTSLAARRAASHNYPFGAFLAQLKKSSGRFVTFDHAQRRDGGLFLSTRQLVHDDVTVGRDRRDKEIITFFIIASFGRN